MSNRTSQLKAFYVQDKATHCPEGHPLEKTDSPTHDKNKYANYAQWICDDCQERFKLEDLLPNHCSKCDFDLCNNCVEKTVCRQMEIPLKEVKVTGQIDDWLSDLTLRQVYTNETSNDLETNYVFPIDPDAAIYKIVATIGDRTVEAVCKEKEQAKQEYKEAVSRGQFSTFGREVHGDLFEMSVGRIGPGETVDIAVSYVIPLSFKDGFDVGCEQLKDNVWRMSGIIPLTSFPRYCPDASGSTSTPASTIKITNSVPYSLEVDLDVATSLPIAELQVTSYDRAPVKEDLSKIGLGLASSETVNTPKKPDVNIQIERSGEHTAKITGTNLPMNIDFKFELAVKPVMPVSDLELLNEDEGESKRPVISTEQMHLLGVPSRVEVAPESSLQSSKEVADRFKLAGVLPVVVSSSELTKLDSPAEIIFVLDCSGSMTMSGWGQESNSPIAQCAELTKLFIHSLPSTCTFNIIKFGSTFNKLFEHPQPATGEYRAKALQLAQNLKANLGGTEILSPLKAISQTPITSGRVRQVFVLTDGSVSNTAQVIQQVARDSVDARYFSIGIGNGCSGELVKGVADAGKGSCEFVDVGDLAPTVMALMDRALRPAVSDWTVEFSVPGVKVATTKTYPIFMGQPGLIYYFGDSVAADEVVKSGLSYTFKGTLNGKTTEIKGHVSSSNVKSSTTCHRLAAKRVITELEWDEEYGYNTDKGQHMKKEVTTIGTVFNLASQETGFVGVETTSVIEETENSSWLSWGKTKLVKKLVTKDVPLFKPVKKQVYPYGSCDMSEGLPLSSCSAFSSGYRGGVVTDCSMSSGGYRLGAVTDCRMSDRAPEPIKHRKGGQSSRRFSRPHNSNSSPITKLDFPEKADEEKINSPTTTKSISSLLAKIGDNDLFSVGCGVLENYGLPRTHPIWFNTPLDTTNDQWFSAIILAYLEMNFDSERALWGLAIRRVINCLEKTGRGHLVVLAKDAFNNKTT